MADDRRVSLGCGTLILIALIVLIFSNQNQNGSAGVQNELRALQKEVSRLRAAVNEQSEETASLRRELQ